PISGPSAGAPGPVAPWLSDPVRPLPGHALRGDLRRPRVPRRAVLGSLAGAGALAAALFALGARPAVVPGDHPGEALDLLAQVPGTTTAAALRTGAAADLVGPGAVETADEAQAGVLEVGAWLRDHDWAFPETLPAGWVVTRWAWVADGDALEVDLEGPSGTPVVLTEQQGRLDLSALEGAPLADVGGRDVHVLASAPWHGVWQSGDCVVQVLAPTEADAAALVAAIPAAAYDDGLAARLDRGWGTVTAALERP
uniref:hypothetical protein n=1 Tax=Cellulomonas endophytica TaxID=2494735 RepID=UPI0013E9982E